MKTNYDVFRDDMSAKGGSADGIRALGLDPDATGGAQALRDEIEQLKAENAAIRGRCALYKASLARCETQREEARNPQVEVPARVSAWARMILHNHGLYDSPQTAAAVFIEQFVPKLKTRVDRLVSAA